MKFEEIKKELQQKKYRPIYFLQGEESYFIDMLSDLIENNALTPSEQSFNQMVVYGKETDLDSIITTARRYPMMAERQVVIVKEAQHIRDITRLEIYAKRPLKTTILVVLYKGKNIRSNSKLAKAITKNEGVVFSAKRLYENKIPAWIQGYTRSKKLQLAPDAIALLTEYLGTNLGKISNEIDKLALNVDKGQRITKQQVADNIGISKDYNVFELQKALAQNDKSKVFKIANYFASNPKAAPLVVVVASLYRFFGKLYVYHHLRNKSEAEILKGMGLNNRWFLRDYQSAARYFKLSQTKQVIALLHEYDLKSKGVNNVAMPSGELLRELVIRMLP